MRHTFTAFACGAMLLLAGSVNAQQQSQSSSASPLQQQNPPASAQQTPRASSQSDQNATQRSGSARSSSASDAHSGSSVHSQVQSHQSSQTTVQSRQSLPQGESGLPGGVYRVSELMGLDVRNASNDDLGEIKDVVIDAQGGCIRYVALSSGGFLGIGDKLLAVPWQTFRIQREGDRDMFLVLNVDKQVLESAPSFDNDNWPNFADATWTRRIDSHYGVESQRMERQAMRPFDDSRSDSTLDGRSSTSPSIDGARDADSSLPQSNERMQREGQLKRDADDLNRSAQPGSSNRSPSTDSRLDSTPQPSDTPRRSDANRPSSSTPGNSSVNPSATNPAAPSSSSSSAPGASGNSSAGSSSNAGSSNPAPAASGSSSSGSSAGGSNSSSSNTSGSNSR